MIGQLAENLISSFKIISNRVSKDGNCSSSGTRISKLFSKQNCHELKIYYINLLFNSFRMHYYSVKAQEFDSDRNVFSRKSCMKMHFREFILIPTEYLNFISSGNNLNHNFFSFQTCMFKLK